MKVEEAVRYLEASLMRSGAATTRDRKAWAAIVEELRRRRSEDDTREILVETPK